jgi:hypothetical protein
MPGNLIGDQVSEETRAKYGSNGLAKIISIDSGDETENVSSNLILAVNGDCYITAKTKRGLDINSQIRIMEGSYYIGCFEEITLKAESSGELHVFED